MTKSSIPARRNGVLVHFLPRPLHDCDAVLIQAMPDGTFTMAQFVAGAVDAGWGVLTRARLDRALKIAVKETAEAAVTRRWPSP